MNQTNEKGARVRFPPPLVFLAALLLGIFVQNRFLLWSLSIPPAFRISFGVLVSLIGILLVGSARVWFKRTGQSPIPWKPSPELILKGPYRFTRNPMYVGITTFLLGLGLALNNLWISLFAFPALLAVHFIAVLPEEKYLCDKFGETYKNYLSQVRRYL